MQILVKVQPMQHLWLLYDTFYPLLNNDELLFLGLVSIGRKQYKQKRLLLLNLKESYQLFSEKFRQTEVCKLLDTVR